MTTGKTIALKRWTFVRKVMSLLFNMLSRLVIAFLPRSKHFLISWLQSPSAVILEPKKIKSITVSIVSPSICYEVMGPDMWTTVLSNSMKLWAMPCKANQDEWVMVESSGKTWSTGKGNGKPLQYSCLENPWTVWKGKKIGHRKMNSSDCPISYSKEILPERMKRLSQNENSTQLWMWLVMEVKSNAVRTILHRTLEC